MTNARRVSGLVGLWLAGTLGLWAQAVQAPAVASLTDQGVALFKEGRYAEAKPLLMKSLAADSRDALAHAYLGMTLYNFDRDADGAMEHLERAVSLDPGRSRFHQWLGAVYGGKAGSSGLLKGAYYAKKCLAEFEKGVELDPKDPDAREALMQYYLNAPGLAGGSVEKAKEQTAELLKLDRLRGLIAQGGIAQYEKEPAKAEGFYRQAMAEAPDKGLPYNLLGYLLLQARRTDEAVETFRKYVQATPADPNAHDSLAEGLLAQGKVEESLAEYTRALEIDPRFSASCLGLAACHERRSEWEKARQAYGRYLELVPPKSRGAESARKKLAALQGK